MLNKVFLINSVATSIFSFDLIFCLILEVSCPDLKLINVLSSPYKPVRLKAKTDFRLQTWLFKLESNKKSVNDVMSVSDCHLL